MSDLLDEWRRRVARLRGGATAANVPGGALDDWSPAARPIFVGGTGRSGTTVTARMLGYHAGCHVVRTELKFITGKGGLCDLVDGLVSYKAFESQILGPGFRRDPSRGLYTLIDRSRIHDALPVLRDGLRTDRCRAARRFVHLLLDPMAEADGATAWVEMTPTNAEAAPRLLAIFPDMRLVHTVRDGRDVACSIVKLDWGPRDLHKGLDWWSARLERAFEGCDRVPADRVLLVQIEDLLIHNREGEYRRLLDFVGLDDDPAMRGYFDQEMDAEHAHAGRWREEVPPDELASFEAHYARLVERLWQQGRPYHPEGASAGAVATAAPAAVAAEAGAPQAAVAVGPTLSSPNG